MGLREVMLEEGRDLYSAEKQLVKAQNSPRPQKTTNFSRLSPNI